MGLAGTWGLPPFAGPSGGIWGCLLRLHEYVLGRWACQLKTGFERVLRALRTFSVARTRRVTPTTNN